MHGVVYNPVVFLHNTDTCFISLRSNRLPPPSLSSSVLSEPLWTIKSSATDQHCLRSSHIYNRSGEEGGGEAWTLYRERFPETVKNHPMCLLWEHHTPVLTLTQNWRLWGHQRLVLCPWGQHLWLVLCPGVGGNICDWFSAGNPSHSNRKRKLLIRVPC